MAGAFTDRVVIGALGRSATPGDILSLEVGVDAKPECRITHWSRESE